MKSFYNQNTNDAHPKIAPKSLAPLKIMLHDEKSSENIRRALASTSSKATKVSIDTFINYMKKIKKNRSRKVELAVKDTRTMRCKH